MSEREAAKELRVPAATLRVWVRPDMEDELRRYRNVIAYDRQNVPGETLVPATLTIDHEPEQAEDGRRKE